MIEFEKPSSSLHMFYRNPGDITPIFKDGEIHLISRPGETEESFYSRVKEFVNSTEGAKYDPDYFTNYSTHGSYLNSTNLVDDE